MTTAELHPILVRMRERLAAPERWTKGESARTALQYSVDVHDPRATCWCLMGAYCREVHPASVIPYTAFSRLFRRLMPNVPDVLDYGLSDWNDAPERTHADVLELLDRMIAETR
jgi:hypothetical protein